MRRNCGAECYKSESQNHQAAGSAMHEGLHGRLLHDVDQMYPSDQPRS
jgi:hypothetical protein